MTVTEQEMAAAHQLGEAFVKFIIAWEQGAAERRRHQIPTAREVACKVDETAMAPESKHGHRNEPESPLLTLLETAKLLRISDRHLRTMSFPHGPIPVVRIGQRLLYSRNDLEAAIEMFRSSRRQADHEESDH